MAERLRVESGPPQHMIDDPPGDDATPSRLYEAAAAEELVMARAEALRGMRQTGVDVLDISPRAMTSSVINRYLEIKARASL